jgi:1-acyl-sn-glycerol-3-phosphate acyltransferase
MGAFTTAVDTGNPIVPVVINGTRSVLRPDSWFPRLGSIHIDILEPIDPSEIKDTNDRWQHTVRLSEKTRRAMLTHLREPDLSE